MLQKVPGSASLSASAPKCNVFFYWWKIKGSWSCGYCTILLTNKPRCKQNLLSGGFEGTWKFKFQTVVLPKSCATLSWRKRIQISLCEWSKEDLWYRMRRTLSRLVTQLMNKWKKERSKVNWAEAACSPVVEWLAQDPGMCSSCNQ